MVQLYKQKSQYLGETFPVEICINNKKAMLIVNDERPHILNKGCSYVRMEENDSAIVIALSG